jgi:tetratricopeptide (TPR) repeat protein
VFRIVTPILVPALLLGLTEGLLRVAGVGYSTDTFATCRVSGETLCCNNSRFAWQFFPPDIARDFSPFAFAAEKPAGTYRIFVLGESAAQGVPEPAFSLGRLLEAMLRQMYPAQRFEVISLAMPAINSHAIRQIARDCLQQQPDLLVVYMGNNEVVGPYGAGTVFAPLKSRLALIRANIRLKSSRLVQLTDDLRRRLPWGDRTPRRWAGLEMFLGRPVRLQDASLQQVYGHFEANLADIRHLAEGHGVPILFSTVAVNLKDCPPFASEHRDGMSDEQLQTWQQLYRQGMDREEAGDFAGAIDAYRNALIQDPEYAETHFRLGRCYWETQQYDPAAEAFSRACELDTLRFRADEQINQIVRRIAQESRRQGVYFVDAAQAMADASEHHVPGNRWFYEHVHMTFAGNYLVAGALLEQIEPLLPQAIRQARVTEADIPSEQDCAQALGYTALDRYRVADQVLHNFIMRPPFTDQAYHAQRVRQWEADIQTLKNQIDQTPFESYLQAYRQAIERNPSDWHLHWIYASLLASEQVNDQAAALQHYEIVQKALPLWASPYVFMGLAASKLGHLDQGMAYSAKAIALDKTQFEAYFNLGYAYQLQHKDEQAIEHYRLALRYRPGHVNACMNLGVLLFNQGKSDEAIATYQAGLQDVPDCAELRFNLGVIYEKTGRVDDAAAQYRQALDIVPDSAKYRKALGRVSRR